MEMDAPPSLKSQNTPLETLKLYTTNDPMLQMGSYAKQRAKPDMTVVETLVTLGYCSFSIMTSFQLLRITFPLLYQLVSSLGFTLTPVVGACLFVTILITVPLSKLVPGNAGIPLAIAVTLSIILRLVMQIVTQVNDTGTAITLPYGIAGCIAALWTMVLLIGTMLDLPRDVRSFIGPLDGALMLTGGTLLGWALDDLIRACWITYDPVWIPGAAPMAVSVILLAIQLALCIWFTLRIAPLHVRLSEPKVGRFGRVYAYALVLQPQFIFFQSQAFLASQAPMSAYLACGLVIGGNGVALILVDLLSLWIWKDGSKHSYVETRKPWRLARILGIVFGCVTAILAGVIPIVRGGVSGLFLVLGQIFTGLCLYCILCEEPWMPRSKPWFYWLTTAGGFVGFLVWFALLLLYPLHYELNLPFPNQLLGPIAIILSLLGFLEPRWSSARSMLQEAMELENMLSPITPNHPTYKITEDLDPADSKRDIPKPKEWIQRILPWLGGLTIASAVITGCALAANQATAPIPKIATWPLTFVSYNTAMGRSDDSGGIAFKELGDEIAELDQDVICMQEVGRGWPLASMSDFASYLQHRFNYQSFYVPAADNQFGNMVLSKVPFTNPQVVPLPKGGGSMGRSALRITVDVTVKGTTQVTPTNIYCTHLAHRNTPTTIAARQAQMQAILQNWNGYPYAVIGGDFNPQNPDLYADLYVMEKAGFHTSQNIHNCTMPTSNENCSDFIFLTPDLEFNPPVYTTTSQITDHKPAIGTIWKVGVVQ